MSPSNQRKNSESARSAKERALVGNEGYDNVIPIEGDICQRAAASKGKGPAFWAGVKGQATHRATDRPRVSSDP